MPRTIAQSLTDLAGVKAAIKASIIAKGQAVASNDPMSAYAGKIDAIQTGSPITGITDVVGVATEALTAGDVVARRYLSGLASGLSIAESDASQSADTFTTTISCVSMDGTVILLTEAGASPRLLKYTVNLSTGVLTKVGTMSIGAVGTIYDMRLSEDNQYLYLATSASPYFWAMKWNGSTFVAISIPAAPSTTCKSIAVSRDGVYLATVNSTDVYIYKHTLGTDSFAYIGSKPGIGTYDRGGIDLSNDGTYLAVAGSNSPYVSIFKRTGDIYGNAISVGSYQGMNSKCVKFSPDENYLAYSGNYGSPYYPVCLAKRTGDTFARVSMAGTLGVSPKDMKWSLDSKYLLNTINGNGEQVCSVVNDVLTVIASTSPTNHLMTLVHPGGGFVFLIHSDSIKRCNVAKSTKVSKVVSGIPHLPDVCDVGFVESNFAQGANATMKSIIRNTALYPVV